MSVSCAHHEEQLTDTKDQLRELTTSLLTLDLRDGDDLMVSRSELDETHSRCSLDLKRLLSSHVTSTRPTPPTTRDSTGVKLPKLDVYV